MAQYKSIMVIIPGHAAQYVETEPAGLKAALEDGFEIKAVHQIASNPASSPTLALSGAIVITYVLFKP